MASGNGQSSWTLTFNPWISPACRSRKSTRVERPVVRRRTPGVSRTNHTRGCETMGILKKPGGILAVGLVAFMLCMLAVSMTTAQVAAPPPAPAAAAPKIDTGDTAWVLTSSALVLAMTMPGLALFYGGLVRNKNVLGTIMHSFIILCLVSVMWVLWGGGWLAKMGALDFAGGAVVHISSGWAALACALVLGKRKGYGTAYLAPHNLPMTMLGAGLLWFGWFGFNAGSALGANALAASAFLATNTAAAAGALSWMVAEWLHRDKPTTLGAASGAIAGLATITPAAGFVGLFPALFIGLTAGVACYAAVVWKNRFGYDDSLDVVGIHGVGGAIGIFATGLFASKLINPAGANGLFFGNPGQVLIQLATIGAALVFALVGTFIILKLIDWTIGLRVDAEEEERGLDLSQHEERAYS